MISVVISRKEGEKVIFCLGTGIIIGYFVRSVIQWRFNKKILKIIDNIDKKLSERD